ncbi:MAG TPA: hypothetical protein VEC36_11390 [Patescibacteria group bacterium]|nr:hypothetical protein [Patescibacteria group bacterium]
MLKFVLTALLMLLSFTNVAAQWPIIQQGATTKSNVYFVVTNTGIYGLDDTRGSSGAIWPRYFGNRYMIGGGLWFGAKKDFASTERKLVTITYNPDNWARSWMTPGLHGDDMRIIDWYQYKLYNSTQYYADGSPKDTSRFYWPVWNQRGKTGGKQEFWIVYHNHVRPFTDFLSQRTGIYFR